MKHLNSKVNRIVDIKNSSCEYASDNRKSIQCQVSQKLKGLKKKIEPQKPLMQRYAKKKEWAKIKLRSLFRSEKANFLLSQTI